jgi:RNA polymerase sigma factor FliA
MPNLNELWREYKVKGDTPSRQQLITHYAYLTRYVVDRMLIRPSSVMGYEDLLGHAIVGLIDAVERFDLEKGVKFETYAIVRIRGAVLDAVKSLDWAPRSVRASEHDLKRTFAELEAALGRPATDEEVATELGMDIDSLNDAVANIGQSSLLSLEELMVASDDSARVNALGAGADKSWDPLCSAEFTERMEILGHAIDGLPEREKLVISLYYKEDLTLKEIAATLGVTEARVCQIHSKSVLRLNGKLTRHRELLLQAA